MENASKALIIAGTVLISVLVITMGVFLFNSFSQYTTGVMSELELKKMTQYNSQFYKYEGKIANAHEVVSIANLAKENNIYYQVENESKSSENSTYITIAVDNYVHFEKMTEDEHISFIKANSYKVVNGNLTTANVEYKCTSIGTNKYGRVNYVRFVKN